MWGCHVLFIPLKEQFCLKVGIIFIVFSESLYIKYVKIAKWELQEGHLEKKS